jgi:hypothetical protein
MENKSEQGKVADGDEKYQSEHFTPLMPDAPGLNSQMQWLGYHPSVTDIAKRCDKSKDGCNQAFVPLIHAEPKRLKEIEYCPDDNSIDDAVSQPVATLLKRVCSGK